MWRRRLAVIAIPILLFVARASGDTVTFTLLTHADNQTLLPQPKGQVGVSGDHLLRTADDITGSTFNPQGCFSFNLMNPVGILEPDYPPGYAEGIHSMTGALALDVDLRAGGAVSVGSLAFDGYVAPGKSSAQRLVSPGDTAADGNHGLVVDGLPNNGTYTASAGGNWDFELTFDWYFDTPYGGTDTIDMTFSDYRWTGFIIPISQLTETGMAAVALDDPLGFYGGSSGDFESWLLSEVKPRLPADAAWLLFAQGTAHPVWTDPGMGMTTDGIVSQTVLAYAVPEPATVAMLLGGAVFGLAAARRSPKREK